VTDHEIQRLAFCIVQARGICPVCDQVIIREIGLTLLQVAYDHATACLAEDDAEPN